MLTFNFEVFKAPMEVQILLLSSNRNEPKQRISTAWQITEVSNSEKRERRAVNSGNHADLRTQATPLYL